MPERRRRSGTPWQGRGYFGARTLTGLSRALVAHRKRRGKEAPARCVQKAGVERYTTYRLGGMRDPASATLAATSKCLARSNKSGMGGKTTLRPRCSKT